MTQLYIYIYETQSRAHQAEYRRFISRAHFCHHYRRAPPAPFPNVYIHSKPNRASAAFSVSRNINRHTMPPQTIFIKCIHMGRRCVNHRTARARCIKLCIAVLQAIVVLRLSDGAAFVYIGVYEWANVYITHGMSTNLQKPRGGANGFNTAMWYLSVHTHTHTTIEIINYLPTCNWHLCRVTKLPYNARTNNIRAVLFGAAALTDQSRMAGGQLHPSDIYIYGIVGMQ